MANDAKVAVLNESIQRAFSRLGHKPFPGISKRALVKRLTTSILESRLTFFVGAGISYPNGLPSWVTLLHTLSKSLVPSKHARAFDLLSVHDSPLVTARYLKQGVAVPDRFHVYVKDALYSSGVDYSAPNDSADFIIDLLKLAHEVQRPAQVITYNFDNVLEHRIQALPATFQFDVICDDRSWHNAHNLIRIYHVHGFVPNDRVLEELPGPDLILSEDEFHRLMNNANKWQNQVQLSALASKDCVFVGLSMTDPNLRRLLDAAKRPDEEARCARTVIAKPYKPGGDLVPGGPKLDAKTAKSLNEIKSKICGDLGADIFQIDDYAELNALAGQVIKRVLKK